MSPISQEGHTERGGERERQRERETKRDLIFVANLPTRAYTERERGGGESETETERDLIFVANPPRRALQGETEIIKSQVKFRFAPRHTHH